MRTTPILVPAAARCASSAQAQTPKPVDSHGLHRWNTVAVVKGDVDGNGVFDAADVAMMEAVSDADLRERNAPLPWRRFGSR